MKEKGFTLIELLAVIVILSVITLITVPMITNVIEESKKKALVSSVEGILDSTDYFTMGHETGVYEFLFDEEHQGSTKKGEQLDYRGSIDGEGKLYLDKEGNVSICISNDKYYVYKNYNSGIIVGERKAGNCIIGFDALTNKYVAMLDDGTGQVSNVYSKDEVNNLVDNLDTKITNNTNEITNMKSNIEELQNNLNNYALQSELDKTNGNLNNLSSLVSENTQYINNLKNNEMKLERFTVSEKMEPLSSSNTYQIPLSGGNHTENIVSNDDGTITINKSGYYLITVGMHGYLTSKGYATIKLEGVDRIMQIELSNPTEITIQVLNAGSIVEYVSKGTKISLYALIHNGTAGIFSNNESRSSYLEIINLN